MHGICFAGCEVYDMVYTRLGDDFSSRRLCGIWRKRGEGRVIPLASAKHFDFAVRHLSYLDSSKQGLKGSHVFSGFWHLRCFMQPASRYGTAWFCVTKIIFRMHGGGHD